MATPTAHRTLAIEFLEKAQGYAPSSAPRMAYLAEAQVHATLALAPEAPVRFVLGAEPTEADLKAMAERAATAPIFAMDDHGTPPVTEVAEALTAPAKPARRTRKAPAAKEADK